LLVTALSLNLIGALVLALWTCFCFRIQDGHVYVATGRLKWMSKWFPSVGTLLLVIGFALQIMLA